MASIDDLTQESGFVFEGEVQKLGASSATGYPASAETAIVKVTQIVKTTPSLEGYSGQEVTVHLQAPVSLKEGQRAVFFTHGTHYGDGLVVAELGHHAQGAGEMAAELNPALEATRLHDLTQRTAQAELVITGVASAPKRHAHPAIDGTWHRVSEHAADWHVTTVTVESVEKGDHKEKTKDVYFAASTDIAWYRSPKIKEGDRGVWLLHHRDHRGHAVPGLAVTHPLDFRPAEEAELVRSLVK
jgi:hypothetical protein